MAANPPDYIVIARKHLWRAGIRLPGSIVLPVLVCLAARTGASLVWHSTFPDWQGGIQDGNPLFLRSWDSRFSRVPDWKRHLRWRLIDQDFRLFCSLRVLRLKLSRVPSNFSLEIDQQWSYQTVQTMLAELLIPACGLAFL